MIDTILVPLDGSPLSERALPVAGELARALSAKVVLMCVAGRASQLGRTLSDDDRKAVAETYSGVREEDHALSTDPRMVEHAQGQVRAVAEAESYLERVAAKLREEGLIAEVAVPYGDAVDGILTEIALRCANLVVMSTRGHSTVRRLLTGSVAQAVLERSPVPVLLVPPERD